MPKFTSLLKVAPLPDGRSWCLLEPLVYELNHGSDARITVPAGFVTDFASVPRPLWWLFSPWGRHGNAAVLHDYLYWTQTRTRGEADRLFLEGMAQLGTLVTVRYAMWLAVRVFGGFAWWSNKTQREAGVTRCLGILPNVFDPVPPRGLDRLLRILWRGKVA